MQDGPRDYAIEKGPDTWRLNLAGAATSCSEHRSGEPHEYDASTGFDIAFSTESEAQATMDNLKALITTCSSIVQ
jgi:hypothetical protein